MTVLAGGNDAFRLTSTDPFTASVTVFVLAGDTVEVATQKASGQVVAAMGVAGAQLAALIKNEIVGRGAKKVLVGNLPNFGVIPASVAKGAGGIALGTAMSQQFNAQLVAGLAGVPGILIVDFYDEFTKISADAAYRAQIGVTNATNAACATTNALAGRALVCNSSNLAVANPSGYVFADDAHPTPLGHKLLAQRTLLDMLKAGWL